MRPVGGQENCHLLMVSGLRRAWKLEEGMLLIFDHDDDSKLAYLELYMCLRFDKPDRPEAVETGWCR